MLISAYPSLLYARSESSVSVLASATALSAKVPRGPKDAVLSPPSRNDSGKGRGGWACSITH